MTERHHVFLSYSRNDRPAALDLCKQFQQHGLTSLFRDDESIPAGDRWLDRLQDAVDGCEAFVVLIGRDAVARWVGAETRVALCRHFDPHDDAKRLPIFPILLGNNESGSQEVQPYTDIKLLPAFLRQFQATVWTAGDALPEDLLNQIRERKLNTYKDLDLAEDQCPFVGLHSFQVKDAKLFFGRRKETLEAITCFFDVRPGKPPVRWLEIDGNSGSGKSSLMNAGILPLVEQGWLWRPRVRFAKWIILGPMMPGQRPVTSLAQHLASTFTGLSRKEEMADVRKRLEEGDERALAEWLKGRLGLFPEETAFLLAIDQFEELFTFADPTERDRFDHLLACALKDNDCPLFVISTVRSDFNHYFAEDLPLLVKVRNHAGRWTMSAIGEQGLREVIDGPADLARLDVSEVREMLIRELKSEAGALPLIENALTWLWDRRACDRGRKPKLSGKLLNDQEGAAGILSHGAEQVLTPLDEGQRGRALDLLFQLVRVDPEGVRHMRRTITLATAITVAGGGECGRELVDHLAGIRPRTMGVTEDGPVRLITILDEGVTLIHETLIRSEGLDASGKPQPYWPTLWDYIEEHKERAVWRERLRDDAAAWVIKGRSAGLQWSLETVREAAKALQPVIAELCGDEREFLGSIDREEMLAELQWPQTSHRRRLVIGERLDVLGDPRPGVGTDAQGTPDIDWCKVEGGALSIDFRSDPNDPCSPVVGSLARNCRPFRISRYPITAAQFRAFVEAEDGWNNPACWSDGLYRDPEGNSHEFGRYGNGPATYVTWFEAVAFCRWLSRRCGLAIRLPDEWEWQQAGVGSDGKNLFPWGAGWIQMREPYRANILESGIGGPTAVGMYPHGASRSGALDMAGTVWEWCINEYDSPGAVSSQDLDRYDTFEMTGRGFDRRTARVVRGGSWSDTQYFARSTFRFGGMSTRRTAIIGFRVVCSFPSSGH